MILLTDRLLPNAGTIMALYHRRWDIETIFCENKRLLGATHLRARTPAAFAVELLTYELYRILMALVIAAASAESAAPRWNDLRARRHSTPQAIALAWSAMSAALNSRLVS